MIKSRRERKTLQDHSSSKHVSWLAKLSFLSIVIITYKAKRSFLSLDFRSIVTRSTHRSVTTPLDKRYRFCYPQPRASLIWNTITASSAEQHQRNHNQLCIESFLSRSQPCQCSLEYTPPAHFVMTDFFKMSGRGFDGIAFHESSVHVDGDCNSILWIPTVVQVIAVFGVHDIHIIVVVPVV